MARPADPLRWGVIAAAAVILTYQLFIPPIVGLADQGDFVRMIGRFGYGPEDKSPALKYAFVAPKYVLDPSFRFPEWEQISSEYLFVGSAVLLNRLVSKDGKLDIVVVGLVHTLVFLAVFARLLTVTRHFRGAPLLWIGALMVLTDVGYAAYWNSFYAEPAVCIFFLLLLAESIAICESQGVCHGRVARWALWAILLVMAKAQNAPLGVLLALFSLRLPVWAMTRSIQYTAVVAAMFIGIAATVSVMTIPKPIKLASAYNVLFMAILPESKNPSADLRALGLDAEFAKYSGTGAWTPRTIFPEMISSGLIGKNITPASVARFYLLRPARMWRHAKALAPLAFSLRPEHCGNFERTAGYAPGARSGAFSLWSRLRERYLSRVGKIIVALLLIFPAIATAVWIRLPAHRRHIEFFALLSTGSLMAFLAAAFGDAWDNVKHFFLFNLLIDACLISAAAFVWTAACSRGQRLLSRLRKSPSAVYSRLSMLTCARRFATPAV